MDNLNINYEPEDASNASSNAGLGDRSVHEDSPDSVGSVEDIWQRQLQRSLDDGRINVEIASISDFIESAQNDLVEIGLALGEHSSTPRIRSARTYRQADNSEPIDIIDLSNFEVHPRTARLRSPEAIIDLCSPDTSRRPVPRPVMLPRRSGGSVATSTARANRTRRDTSLVTSRACSPSPPKRARSAELDKTADMWYKCPVCLEDVRTRDPCSTTCGHVFCKSCIDTAVRSTKKCPLCNKKITVRNIIRIYL